ncbi:ABC transporter permease [Achromobacter sp. AONIH1]|uniref:ABC transporter permease n=1 Tax=unclassified Achromobacter TaxID=2626865 RepID=UPI000CD04C96|nr:ABC transporter permease [Achromobacter sp. AONIH1]AUT45157.1 ABC transporter permease [Achromobacter sp. AONIH1]
MFIRLFANALSDISAGMKRLPLVATLGWQDVRQRYRRSMLGPFWLTISMGVMIGTIGLVFGQIFKAPTEEYLPFLAVGLILWGFISTALTEGCTNFIQADAIIKQLPIPLIVHVLRPIWRNVIILAHNFAIFPIVLFVMDRPVTETIWLALPGFLLLLLNLTWLSTALGVVCARYRDIPQIIASLMQVVFYLTPIMWLPNLLPERAGMYMLTFNPFFHLIEIVRAPLLGQLPSTQNWLAACGLAVFGWTLTLALYGRYRRRIAYWL